MADCWLFFSGLCIAAIASTCLYAQSSAGGGSIQGTVRDATDSVIPAAKSNVNAVETNNTSTTETNSQGLPHASA